MNIVGIKARDVTDLMAAGINQIRIYRDISSSGAFAGPPVATINLVAGQEDYEYVDQTGTANNWYESTFYNSTTLLESPHSGAIPGGPLTGPIGVLNVDYVREMTDFPALANLSDLKIGGLIFRAEAMLQRLADRYGGWASGIPNFVQNQTTAARLLLEEIWMRSLPSARMSQALGLMSEKIGTYSYSRRARGQGQVTTAQSDPWDARQLFSPELWDLLRTLVSTSPTKVDMTTTMVFPQLDPTQQFSTGFEIVPYWDGIDEELLFGGDPLHNYINGVRRVIIYPER
jgi:hypothetical protein